MDEVVALILVSVPFLIYLIGKAFYTFNEK
jgi:hypothetical protein